MSKKVKICGINYNFVYEDPGKDEDGNVLWGACDYKACKLILTSICKMGQERKFDIFIHECLHALIYETCSRKYLKKYSEEDFIGQMTVPLATFIRDNITLLRKMGKF